MTVLVVVFVVSGMIAISNNMAYVVKYRYFGTEQLKANVDFRIHNKERDSIRRLERKKDSIEFEAYYNTQIDSLWQQRFEQRERELMDSIKRLQ